mgnify:CR=1 FL=1
MGRALNSHRAQRPCQRLATLCAKIAKVKLYAGHEACHMKLAQTVPAFHGQRTLFHVKLRVYLTNVLSLPGPLRRACKSAGLSRLWPPLPRVRCVP